MTASLFVQHLIVSTLILSVLTGVVFLLCRMLSPHSSRICRTMWLIVLLSGLCWFRISLPLPLLPARQPAETTVMDSITVETQKIAAGNVSDRLSDGLIGQEPVAYASGCYSTPVETPAQQVAPSKVPIAAIIIAIWLGGVLFFLVRGVIEYLRLLYDLSLATPEREPMWESLLAEVNIAPQRIPVVFAESIGPLLVRLPLRTLLVLPEEPWENLSDAAKRGILRHELEHFRRGDILKSFGVWLLSLLHWFNPCARLARSRFDDAAEWACDDAAHGHTETGVAAYARALIAIHENNRLQQAAHRAILGRAIRGIRFTERIDRLTHFRKKEDSMLKKTG